METRRFTRMGRGLMATALLSMLSTLWLPAASAQNVDQAKGVDAKVDYASMVKIGPWDDRNYRLTAKDLELLAPNESELKDPIPVFFRVELRKSNPGMLREGNAQYPRSALQIFKMRYGGYLLDGVLHKGAEFKDGRYHVVPTKGDVTQKEFELRALTTDIKVTSPAGAAESAVKINPVDVNKVVAGSNGPGSGQIMWYSTNGGSSWTQAAALPQGSTCCDPTIDWSSNGQFAYTSTLGGCTSLCNVWVYRSSDGGATWNDLATITPGDGRREVTSAGTSDKQYLHSDKFATSPFKDNIYQCWHDNNTMKFSRSTDFANTWSAPLTMSTGANQSGIGCDLTTDKSGNVYYFWPATNGKTILMRKSTDGGASFAAAVTVANTQDGYDFAIPAMETRRAFMYASADGDVSNSAFANSIYVAWTDTTAVESATPANNHGRIQVAYSRNGGSTWTVRTPHSTANQNTVDRFHPWLGVGNDGKVYVMFYDTTRDASRVAVDVYYAISSDGGDTYAAPIRLTSVISPQIDDGFEWGDYNGLDVVGNQLIAIFTDNRNEGGGAADSIDVYAAGVQLGGAPGNTTPTVTISAPANGSSFASGASVTFTGTATDTEDGNITTGLNWSSSINGAIGTGGSFSTSTLAVGTHTITASATDSGSLTGSSSISVTITGAATVLTNGVAVTGISGAAASQRFFTLAVPAGATNLSFNMSGGTGDADLYVRFGTPPTTTVRDCASESGTNTETCSFPTPSTGTYHVLVYGFATFSGAQLTGSYTAPGGSVTVTFFSVAAEDGRLWESGENGNVGGGGVSAENLTTSLRVGDTNVDEQYKSIVSFDTSSIPDTATITAATVRLTRGTVSGTTPFTTHGPCVADISTGGFGGAAAFATADWQNAATATNVATMSAPASNGAFSTGTLSAAGRSAVNKTGRTQLRVYCTLDDNDDLGFDYIGFYAGENTTNNNKPQLTITYTP